MLGILTFIVGPLFLIYIKSIFSIKKFSIKATEFEAELESTEKEDISMINRNRMKLVEIINKFAKKIDYTLIFEDMDRLKAEDSIQLFTELREINRLLNLYPHKFRATKKTVRFIYVIHDAIFNNMNEKKDSNKLDIYQLEQLKFFDYIMPICPQILGEAAANYIRKCFEDINFPFADDLIGILYKEIDDYRIIQNIANEYCVIKDIYEKRCEKINKDDEKHIMALSIYKTLHPIGYQKIRINKNIEFDNVRSINNNCIDKLIKSNWLTLECLQYIGLTELEIYEYIESLLLSNQIKGRINTINIILNSNYTICHKIILNNDKRYGNIIKFLGYSLLILEIENGIDDLKLLEKINNSNLQIKILEQCTNIIINNLQNFYLKEFRNGEEKNINKVSKVLEYLLLFSDNVLNKLPDYKRLPGIFFFKCYQKLSKKAKEEMIKTGIIIEWINKEKENPNNLKEIIELFNHDELIQLSKIDCLDKEIRNYMRKQSSKEGAD